MSFIKSASPETIRAYQSDLAQTFGLPADFFYVRISFKGAPTGSVEPQNDAVLLAPCRAALNSWAALAPATRNRKVACLKSFLHWLHEEGALERDLSIHLHAPKVPVRLPHHLSVDEVMALLNSVRHDEETAESADTKNLAIRDHALLLLLYGGGLRVSEASGLTWSQVEGSGSVLRIMGKGSRERIIALPPVAAKALAKLRQISGDSASVFGEKGLSTRKAFEIVRSRGSRAGLLQPLHPHALRHSYATHLLSSGANLRTLQELLGHRTLQATQRYTHLGLDQLANTLESFHPLGGERKKGK